MNQTQNYQLSQWESTDRILMSDFNGDNTKIDAALKALDDELNTKGNCQIWTTSYVGNGNYGSTQSSLTFDKKPLLVYVIGSSTFGLFTAETSVIGTENGVSYISSSWDENTLSWFAGDEDRQLNASGTTYIVIALLTNDG